jgi:peptide-methionine (S)-S-oxide reductase
MAIETATLGGGCFWCIEGAMRHLSGVSRAESGYAGGHVPNPTYEQVCGKGTGHAEVVQIDFEPAVIGYADLLRMFFTLHDPTTADRRAMTSARSTAASS